MTNIPVSEDQAYNNPLKPAMVGALAIGAFVLLFALWGYAAPLSSAAIAEGSLQVQAQRQSVQHPYGVLSRNFWSPRANRSNAANP